MPFVNIKVAGPTLAPEQIARLQRGTTRLMAEVMRKKPELTAVLIEQATAWSVGTDPVRTAAHVDVKITAGTNSAAEKAQFVAESTSLLRSVLGADLNPVAYVVVHELAGDAWGWDGITQARRAQTADAI